MKRIALLFDLAVVVVGFSPGSTTVVFFASSTSLSSPQLRSPRSQGRRAATGKDPFFATEDRDEVPHPPDSPPPDSMLAAVPKNPFLLDKPTNQDKVEAANWVESSFSSMEGGLDGDELIISKKVKGSPASSLPPEETTETIAETPVDPTIVRNAASAIEPILKGQVERNVSEKAIKGALMLGAVAAALAGKGVALTGAASIGTAYLAITTGPIGEVMRTVGNFAWNVGTGAVQAYKTAEETTASRVARLAELRLQRTVDAKRKAELKQRSLLAARIQVDLKARQQRARKKIEEQKRLAEEAIRLEEEAANLQQRLAEVSRLKEQARIAEEIQRRELEEQERLVAEVRKSEEARQARLAAQIRARAEEKRLAKEAREAEKRRQLKEARLAEAEKAKVLAEIARMEKEAELALQAEITRKEEEAKVAEKALLAEIARKEEDAKLAEQARLAEIAAAENARLAEIARRKEEARAAEEARLAEIARREEEAKLAEKARLAEIARAEETRLAEIARMEEEARVAEMARLAEIARKEEEARVAETARLADKARKKELAKLAEQARLAGIARSEEARLEEKFEETQQGSGDEEMDKEALAVEAYEQQIGVRNDDDKIDDQGSWVGTFAEQGIGDPSSGIGGTWIDEDGYEYEYVWEEVDEDAVYAEEDEQRAEYTKNYASLQQPMIDWSSYTVSDLRAELERRGLSTTGKKVDLVAMLEQSDVEQLMLNGVGDDSDGDLKRIASGAADALGGLDFDSMTVPQLKEELRARGLRLTGKKSDLVTRLQSYEAGQIGYA